MFAPSKKAGHMGATDQLCATDQKVLANGVPSTHGTNQLCTTSRPLLAPKIASWSSKVTVESMGAILRVLGLAGSLRLGRGSQMVLGCVS